MTMSTLIASAWNICSIPQVIKYSWIAYQFTLWNRTSLPVLRNQDWNYDISSFLLMESELNMLLFCVMLVATAAFIYDVLISHTFSYTSSENTAIEFTKQGCFPRNLRWTSCREALWMYRLSKWNGASILKAGEGFKTWSAWDALLLPPRFRRIYRKF